MKTAGNVAKEQISALADGELDEAELDSLLAALRQSEKREDWDLYHQIGDVMRSDDMDVALSSDFSARMVARLDAEPTIIAPAAFPGRHLSAEASPRVQPGKSSIRRYALSGIAAVAAAFAAFVAAPQMMLSKAPDSHDSKPSTLLASASAVAEEVTSDNGQKEIVLRDPQIDEYLFAHQRFSSSLYSTAQFARSATFTNENDK